jgi:hypothetical protein
MTATAHPAPIVVAVLILVVPAVLAGLKGRWGLLGLGMLFGFVGALGRLGTHGQTASRGFAYWLGTESPLWIPWVVGACRLARPTSVWYRRWYSAEKRERAVIRFGRPAAEAEANSTEPRGSGPDTTDSQAESAAAVGAGRSPEAPRNTE